MRVNSRAIHTNVVVTVPTLHAQSFVLAKEARDALMKGQHKLFKHDDDDDDDDDDGDDDQED